MQKKWKIVIGIAVGIIVLGTLGRQCSKAGPKVAALDDESQTHTVARGQILSQIEITGEVQPQTVVSIKSKVSGKIVKFYVGENDYVSMGQKIADIEPDYTQANTLFNTKAQLQKAEIRLANARKDMADKTILLSKQYIPQQEYNNAENELKAAKIDFEQAASQYEMIRELDVPGKVTYVFATAAGMVIERKINVGEMVQSSINTYGEGTVLMKIADLTRMIVKSNINEVDIAKFTLHQEAKIKLDALPYESFEGRIIKIAPSAITENNAKVFPVEISINAGGEKVKPGMTAAVNIIGDSREDVLIIPIRAVFSDDKNQDIVYMMTGSTAKAGEKDPKTKTQSATPLATPVKLGANDMQMVEVVSGLKEGDKISLTEPQTKPNVQIMAR
ncbi:MAG: efflux RND transporter periplasmic adaptor subunit [Candidatus Cloacimonadaceae bacterium]|nr:efflux RND transporter periplasmic adaptor subunit [Candidatus Cloacimonadaceae bacterium]